MKKSKQQIKVGILLQLHKYGREVFNDQEIEFIIAYLLDPKLNPKTAAIKAGYTENTASTKAYLWVSHSPNNPKPHIREFLDTVTEEKMKKAEIIFDKIISETKNVAFANAADLFPIMTDGGIDLEEFKKLPKEVTSAIESIEQKFDKDRKPVVKIKFHNKLKALDQLSKHMYIQATQQLEQGSNEPAILKTPAFDRKAISEKPNNMN